MSFRPPRLLTIAGSDSGGGAGIQADLKTFAAHNTYGMSVITAITAQNTVSVSAVHPVPATIVSAQVDAVFSDLGVDAVKIGMLASSKLIRAVAAGLRQYRPHHVVLDPVMIAKSGDALLADDAVDTLIEELLPLATVVTPNLPEAQRLTGLDPGSEPSLESLRPVARKLREFTGPGSAILIKGGHAGGERVTDWLWPRDHEDHGSADIRGRSDDWTRRQVHTFDHPRQHSHSTHGTGCTLSSAIAARLAHGDLAVAAVAGAIDYLQGAIASAQPLGTGHGPVNHLHRLFPTDDPV